MSTRLEIPEWTGSTLTVGARLHGICRRAKKSIKRSGSAFWARLDGWNALRLAV